MPSFEGGGGLSISGYSCRPVAVAGVGTHLPVVSWGRWNLYQVGEVSFLFSLGMRARADTRRQDITRRGVAREIGAFSRRV